MDSKGRMTAADIPEVEILTVIEQRGQERFGGSRDVYDRLPQYPWKVVLARLTKMCRHDLISFGVNIRFCWLTEKGKDRLAEVRAKCQTKS